MCAPLENGLAGLIRVGQRRGVDVDHHLVPLSRRAGISLRPRGRDVIASLYGIPETDLLKIIAFDPAHAVPVTMRPPLGSGALGETDVYGAQQPVPLTLHEIE